MPQLLVVDDDEMFLFQIREILRDGGYDVVTMNDGGSALNRLREERFDLFITDLRMPRIDGIQILDEIHKDFPLIPVIVMSGHGTIDFAVSAMKKGATDFLVKPFSADHLCMVVEKALHLRKIEEENRILREQVRSRFSFQSIIGKHHKMQRIYETLSVVSPTDATVLLLGETGTGKDLLAHAIHNHSSRKEKPFVKVDCGVLTESLLESELFGHEKGAFTHAYSQRIGRFEYAQGGTIFLNEIGELPGTLQVKLLRVLDEKKFERVGSNKTLEVDVRIIAATNRDIEEEVRQGNFRKDLFYRLDVIQIRIPPLRERIEDIPLLVDHVLEKFGKKLGKKRQKVSPMVLKSLMEYPWPGNVRELENLIEKTLLLHTEGIIESINIPEVHQVFGNGNGKTYLTLPFKDAKKKVVEEFERGYLTYVMDWAGGNISRASKKVGMDYKSFHEKLKYYNIDPHEFKKQH